MNSSFTQRLLITLAALFLLAYVGVQIYIYLGSSYKTETVYLDSVRENAKVSGIVLRQEEVLASASGIPLKVNSGITAYTVEDGTKVSKGMAVAEVYKNEQDAQTINKIRALEAKRDQLVKAGETAPESFGYTDVLNKQIFSEIGSIADQVHSGNTKDLTDPSEKLLELMNTKQITTGVRADFKQPIAELETQIRYFRSQIKTQPSAILADKPGYFIRNVDGLEGYLNPGNLSELKPADLNRLMSMSLRVDNSVAGKLMTSHYWYYITVVPRDDARFRKGRSVTIDFGQGEPVFAVIAQINEDRELDQSVIVFRSDYVNADVVNLRATQADVSFHSISGLRVSTDALRFQGLERGVYVMQGEQMIFRPVNILYEGSGFVLVENVLDEQRFEKSLKLFDEVITEGWQLYDGKSIK